MTDEATREALAPRHAIWRMLTFRLSADQFDALGMRHLGVALLWTWVVGMGRWWDDPDAKLLQHLGLGSVVYAFVLAGLIWLLVLPLRPKRWSYRGVLTFVAMTSPPALLYAIPVERLVDMDLAGKLNLTLLAVVAAWRVALLLRFFVVVPELGWFKGITTALLPLSAIVTTLFALNLHRVVFSLMGSIAENQRTAHDDAYGVLLTLTVLSVYALPVLLILYIVAIVQARVGSATKARDSDG